MANQMQVLESKLSTLRDGTEAMACILANWENVLGAIGMASNGAANLGRMGEEGSADEGRRDAEGKAGELPVTLVRIPVRQEGEDGG